MCAKNNSFENIASRYADVVDKKPIHVYYERPNLLSLLPENITNLRILDLGCGSGWYAEYLSDNGAIVTAIDNSPTMVTLTKKRAKDINAILGDLNEPLDFLPDAFFDIIIAPLTIHYIQDWIFLFKELSKKMKSHGAFIFSTHNPYLEYTLFNLENYFEKVKITDQWENIGTVDFYHHTLHQMSEALHASEMIIERILEPQPLQELQTIDQQLYRKLSSRPWFLFVKAVRI